MSADDVLPGLVLGFAALMFWVLALKVLSDAIDEFGWDFTIACLLVLCSFCAVLFTALSIAGWTGALS